MAVAMSVLLDDLRAETAVLDALLTPLAPDRWDKPTPAPGWVVRDQVSHLAHFAQAFAGPPGRDRVPRGKAP